MNLLLERAQRPGMVTLVPLQFGGGPLFTLWAMAEFSPEEDELVRRYRLNEAVLVADDWVPTLQRSFRTAAVLGIVLWWTLWMVLSWTTSGAISLVATLLLTAFYFNELREQIYVRDLMRGRRFRCFSIVELVQKEAYLTGVSAYLRQVLETAKHWDGRESVPIPVLSPQEAKALVAKGD